MARDFKKDKRFRAPASVLAAGAALVMHGCAVSGPGADLTPGIDRRAPAPPSSAIRFTPVPEGAHVRSAVTDSLVVATWNVHVGGGDLAAFVADLRAGDLTGGTPPGDFVILLQETHRHERSLPGAAALRESARDNVSPVHALPPSGERRDVVEMARELGLHMAYAPAVPNGRPTPGAPLEDRGVAILSSVPMDGIRVLELPRERQRRVALAATLAGESRDGTPWTLQVVSAHLENRAGWGRFLDSFGAARGRQARFLAERMGDGPTVLGGDLNTWAPSFLEPTLGVLEPHFPHTPEVEGATFSVAGIPRRLDHLLFRLPDRGSARALVVGEYYGSDHRPVIGVVALPTSR
jgi:endonuclease/exonuclease/phosphatase family metal-dependent hydrolase